MSILPNTIFSLQGRTLKFDTTASIEPHLVELDQINELIEVKLGGNTFGVEACAAIAKALVSKSDLQIADFSDIFTGRLISEIPLALTSLCTSLLHLPRLTTLDLSDNAFGGRSVEPMLTLLSTHPTLAILKLNNNGLGPAGGAMVAQALLESAQLAKAEGRVSSLRTIICGRNRLENGSANAWAAAFGALGSLVEVKLPQNGIRMEGIEAIVKGLTSCPRLEILDLQDNTATEKGSRAIAVALPSWPLLRELNLSDCLLRPRGGVSIANVLVKGTNPLVSTLLLQSNELDRRSIEILASAITQHLPLLVKLELNGNRGESEDECFEQIRSALTKWDHADALDELDEMEEPEDDDEDEEDEEQEEEEEEEDTAVEKEVIGTDAPDDLSRLMARVNIN